MRARYHIGKDEKPAILPRQAKSPKHPALR
jgi:hypothetical protein